MGHGIVEPVSALRPATPPGGAMQDQININIVINFVAAAAGRVCRRVDRSVAIGLVAMLALMPPTPRLHAASSPARTASRPSAQTESTSPSRALLDTYCVGCHNERLRTANLLLDRAAVSRVGDAAGVGGKVAR